MRRIPILALLGVLLLVVCREAGAAGLLVPRDGSAPIHVRSHRVVAEVTDGLARTTLRQTFVNPGDRAVEAIYLFPLPEGAALTDVAMEVGGQRLEGLLAERQKARRIYDQIVRSRRDPALVEQVGRNSFRLSVFPVMPKQETVVELTWIQHVPLSHGTFRYVYPLALAGKATETEQDLTVMVTFRSSVPLVEVGSPDQDVQIVRKGPGEVIASLERMGARLDADVVVTGRVEVKKATLSVSTFKAADGDGWFLAVVTPPKVKEAQLIPRDVILVLDTSGSMRHDGKIEQAKRAALWLLDNLRPADRVNVLRFSSDVQAFAEEPVPATGKNLKALRKFVKTFGAAGGTALGAALDLSTAVAEAPGRVRSVVLLTDGRPTIGEQDPAKLVELAAGAGQRGLRVFPFGVGKDVHGGLLHGIASAGRGRAEIFRPGGEIVSRLTSFLHRTSSPVIADIRLDAEGIGAYDLFPRPVPDAYLGEQVVLAGRYRKGGVHLLTVSAVLGDRKVELTDEVKFRDEPGGLPAVRDLFARMKMEFLESSLRLRNGLPDDAYYAALQRGAYSTQDEIVEEMIATSLEHRVQCAYTSFIVLLPEDRHRLDPRDLDSLTAAMDRARKARATVSPSGEAPADGGDETAKAGDKATSGRPRYMGPGKAARARPGGSRGRSYRGPAGEVPPGHRDPTDPQPPAENPGTPPPGRPPPGTPPPGTPPPPTPSGPAGGAVATPGGRVARPSPLTFESWIFWWAYNAPGVRADLSVSARPADLAAEVEKLAVPALRKTIANRSISPAVRADAVLALARLDPSAREIFEDLAKKRGRDDPRVEVAALLALGVRGIREREVIEFLVSRVEDGAQPVLHRAAAAVSLGLLRENSEVDCLKARVGEALASKDLSVCSLLALGLIGDSALVAPLSTWLTAGLADGRKLSDLERAHAAAALGRIGDPAAIPALTKALRGKGVLARRSALIALGDVMPPGGRREQSDLVKWLVVAIERETDTTAKSFGLISLGRIAGSPDATDRTRARCISALREWCEKGNRSTEQPFAALGLGLAGLTGTRMDDEARADVVKVLRGRLADLRGDKVALGSFAVAIGMTGVREAGAVDLLGRIAADHGMDRKLREAAVDGLSLLPRSAAAPLLRDVAVSSPNEDVRAAAVRALSVQGDETDASFLRGILTDPKSSARVREECAEALGRLGSTAAVADLVGILEPGSAKGANPDLLRAAAARGLGWTRQDRWSDPLTRLHASLNYRAMVPSLQEILSYE